MTIALALLALFFFALLLWVAVQLQNAQFDLQTERSLKADGKRLLERAVDAARTHADRRKLAEAQRDAAENRLTEALETAVLQEKTAAFLTEKLPVLEARLEHQKAELKMVHAELSDAHKLVDAHLGMADRLVDAIVKMKMAGFVDASPSFNGPTSGLVTAPFTADLRPAVSEADQRGWEKVLEAIQERASGNAQLMNVLTGDAYNWRKAGVPIKQIEGRIWNGWDGTDTMTFTQDDVVRKEGPVGDEFGSEDLHPEGAR